MLRLSRMVVSENNLLMVEKLSPTVLKLYLVNDKEPKLYEFPSSKSCFIAFKNLQYTLRDSHIIGDKVVVMKKYVAQVKRNTNEYEITIRCGGNEYIRKLNINKDFNNQLNDMYDTMNNNSVLSAYNSIE